MFKKLLSVILVTLLMFSLAAIAFAAGTDQSHNDSVPDTDSTEPVLETEPSVPIDGGGTFWVYIDVDVAEGEGTVEGGFSYEVNGGCYAGYPEPIILTATPAEGYEFVYWTIDEDDDYSLCDGASLDNPELAIMNEGSIHAHAYFAPDSEAQLPTIHVPQPGEGWDYYPIKVEVAEGQGTATGDSTSIRVGAGTNPAETWEILTLTATPAEGYRFDRWELEEGSVYDPADIGFTLNDAEIQVEANGYFHAYAYFVALPEPGAKYECFVNVRVSGFGEGTAESSIDSFWLTVGESPENNYQDVTLKVTYKKSCEFRGWFILGDYSIIAGTEKDPVVTIRARSNITACAMVFSVYGSAYWCYVDVDVTQGEGTAVSSIDKFYIQNGIVPEYGLSYADVTLTAAPAEGYRFVTWEIDGDYVMKNGGTLNDTVLTIVVDYDIAAHAKFAPIEVIGYMRGDADSDGKITIMDATRIQRWLAKMVGNDAIDMMAAEVDGDSKITVMDATRIQRVLAKMCDMDGKPLIEEPTGPALSGEEYELPVF